LFPCLVQGENSKDDIVRNIKLAQDYDLDVLIIGRGGGSIEDLWPFNEEDVARAIYNSKIPTISAVGHEIDFTISDFVADLRAATPTGAAEIAVPDIVDIYKHLNQLDIRANETIKEKINYQKLYLDGIKNSYVIKNPVLMYEHKTQQLDLMSEKLDRLIKQKLDNTRNYYLNLRNSYVLTNPNKIYVEKEVKLTNIIDKLELLNPLSVLKRGYSITYKGDSVITGIEQIKENDNIRIKLTNGSLLAVVSRREKDGEN
jgi:exodeoxyribonuclease VII large subunit